jgi:hypothetical protein
VTGAALAHRGEQLSAAPADVRVLAHPVLATEFVHATRSIHNLLFARIKRVAGRTDLYMQLFLQSRSRHEFVSATADYLEIGILRMDFGLHFISACDTQGRQKWARKDSDSYRA